MGRDLTIVGGGLGGLVSAIAAAEAGFDVTLHESRPELGGRARSAPSPYHANWGPHVLYADGPLWAWLHERRLVAPVNRPPLTTRVRVRVDGRARRVPSLDVVRAVVRLRRREAPVDATFSAWAAGLVGEEVARRVASAVGVVTFHHDPGELSAAFVQWRLRRVTTVPPAARYVVGGWGALVDRLAAHARRAGVRIALGERVDALPPAPVVLAVPLDVAAGLLGDDSVAWTGTRTALLDVGLRADRRDCFAVSDLDECGWAETFSMADRTLAPAGEHLVQAQMGLRPGESLEAGVTRVEGLLDVGWPGWRARETWRRRARISDETGALDLPGTTWRDRPAIDRGDGVHLVGDMVAAPGLLSEVTFNAAIAAVEALAARTPSGTRQLL